MAGGVVEDILVEGGRWVDGGGEGQLRLQLLQRKSSARDFGIFFGCIKGNVGFLIEGGYDTKETIFLSWSCNKKGGSNFSTIF